jgi:alpha-beta hydrolase superfamily lysophospholipase
MTTPPSPNARAEPPPPFLPGQVKPQRRPADVVPELRARAFGLIKQPLLGRFDVRWRWPRAVAHDAWDRTSIVSRSGATLAGLYGRAAGERKGVVVCVHPLRREAKGYFLRSGRADVLRANGYDVLAFDLNGFGESTQGDFNYADDVAAAADFACECAGRLPVHALAACFGAVWALAAATREHPFSGIAIEAPLTTLSEYYRPDPVLRRIFELLLRAFPKSAADACPMDAVGRLAGTPQLMVIGGVEDTFAPITMSRLLYEACNLPQAARRIWYVDGAEHLQAFEAAPHEYAARITDFFAGAAQTSALVC